MNSAGYVLFYLGLECVVLAALKAADGHGLRDLVFGETQCCGPVCDLLFYGFAGNEVFHFGWGRRARTGRGGPGKRTRAPTRCWSPLVACPTPTAGGLEKPMLAMNGRAIKVDDQCRTSMRNVWAIGDLTGEPMLARRTMARGEMVANIISGKRRHFAPAAIAAVCFTDPEVVVAGQTPTDATRAGLDCITAQLPFAANGRAMTLESLEGFVRFVVRRDNHRFVGWQAVGRCVGAKHRLLTLAGDGRDLGRCGGHHPRPPDARRGGARGRAAGAGACVAYLALSPRSHGTSRHSVGRLACRFADFYPMLGFCDFWQH